MNTQKRDNLNKMLRQWPPGGLQTAASLRAQGISSALLHHYVQRRWLDQVERGVYRRPGDAPGWQAALHTVQREMNLPVHVGGLTALELQGYGHYMGERALFLYAPPRIRLPAWFEGAAGRSVRFTPTNFLSEAQQESLRSITAEGVSIIASTPERATLEMLYHVPVQVGFGEALEVVSGLASLNMRLMQALLEKCSSVKVKRLFLYCARESGHSWYSSLDRNEIDLGAGKRELVKGGTLDKEFLLTVEARPYTTEIRF
jgi:hypothetical protein